MNGRSHNCRDCAVNTFDKVALGERGDAIDEVRSSDRSKPIGQHVRPEPLHKPSDVERVASYLVWGARAPHPFADAELDCNEGRGASHVNCGGCRSAFSPRLNDEFEGRSRIERESVSEVRQIVGVTFADIYDVELQVRVQEDAVASSVESAGPERLEQARLIVTHRVDIVGRAVGLAQAGDDGKPSNQRELGETWRQYRQALNGAKQDAVGIGNEDQRITRHG